eukprot:TRINITY_DN7650_c0_g1_i1.p1 TRINITY_DN7650_c0_g1~~TRINITY_DN7650_c0_g1_i1.p1  ORF type:complete len:307 (+),score=55.69 TRINITY_DN7650_c0_g1_i1:547-1467(+)
MVCEVSFGFNFSVHHGNGTQHILESDSSIMYFSVHKGGDFYPKTGHVDEVGKGLGKGYTVNVPFTENGMGDADYLACFKHVLLPIAREFNPELVIVSAGFDCGKNDIVGPMRVSTKGFENMMALVSTLANGKIVCALEGGYTLETTAKGAVGCIGVLTGKKPREIKKSIPSQSGLMDIIAAIDVQKNYWHSMTAVPKIEEFKELCRLVFPTLAATPPQPTYWKMPITTYGSAKKRRARAGFVFDYTRTYKKPRLTSELELIGNPIKPYAYEEDNNKKRKLRKRQKNSSSVSDSSDSSEEEDLSWLL